MKWVCVALSIVVSLVGGKLVFFFEVVFVVLLLKLKTQHAH